MALAWTLRDPRVTSTLIGASSVAQLEDNVGALDRLEFSRDELAEIDRLTTDPDGDDQPVGAVERGLTVRPRAAARTCRPRSSARACPGRGARPRRGA